MNDIYVKASKKPIDKTARGAREIEGKRPPRAERLSLQERAFVRAYASDPQSETFGVGVRSAMKAGYGEDGAGIESPEYNAANRAALQLLARPKVKSEIERVFESHQLTVSDRAHAVADILHSPTVETIHTTESIDPEGITRVTSKQTILSSNASNVLKAVDTLNRMDGTYTKAADVVHTRSRVLQPLLDHYSKLMRRTLSESAIQERVEGQGGVVDVEGTALPDTPPEEPSEPVANDGIAEHGEIEEDNGEHELEHGIDKASIDGSTSGIPGGGVGGPPGG